LGTAPQQAKEAKDEEKEEFMLPLPKYPDVAPLTMYNPRKVKHNVQKNLPKSDYQYNYPEYTRKEMEYSRGSLCLPPAYAGKFMPQWYQAKYESATFEAFSHPDKVQLVLHQEPAEMLGKRTIMDTFLRVQGGTVHPAHLAKLRAEERGAALRARLAEEEAMRTTM
jgi:hypothetical protein